MFCLNIKSQHIPARYFSFCILLTVLLVTLSIRSLQGELFITDAQYMVAAGRWIIANGHLPTTDPLSIHSELTYICQQYPICILVAVLYDTFGEMSVRLFFALLDMVAVLFIWYQTFPKAGNRILHCAVSCVFGAVIVYSLRSTPRALDILCLAVSWELMEKYIESRDIRFLFGFPFLGIFIANLHGALWPCAIMLPLAALLDSKLDSNARIALAVTVLLTIASAMLNPYGLDVLSLPFKTIGTGFNDLATVNPVVAAEWHPTENGDLSPQLVLSGSGKKVWWLGKCGHEWEAKISDRALRGYACPLCRKSRPKSHEEFCRAISELNPNIEIIGTYEKSHKKISVRCKKCGYEWETKPNNLQQGRGCPRCAKAGTSRTEQFIFAFLEQVFGADRVKSRDRETIGLELDIVCLNHAWEPGSWVWHCSSSKQRRDRQKIEMCREAGIILHTIYDSCPSKMKETSVDGCLYYTFDLWEEPEHATLKSLCLGWARDIDPAVNLSVIDWNGIELRAAERSGALSHDQFVDKIRQLFGGTIEVVDRYVAMHTRIRVRCKTCGYAWNPKPYYLIQGHGCHKCAGLYQGTVVCLETGKEYKNYRQAALAVGLKGSAGIKDACKNPNHTSGGYHWKLR